MRNTAEARIMELVDQDLCPNTDNHAHHEVSIFPDLVADVDYFATGCGCGLYPILSNRGYRKVHGKPDFRTI